MQPHDNKLFKFFSSKAFTLLAVSLLALIGLAIYRNFWRQKDIDSEVKRLETQLIEARGQQVELVKLVDILESSEYIEREARLRLGLKKAGEQVIAVPANARPNPAVSNQASADSKQRPNPWHWFDYFFGASVRD